ncbi:MAG: DMT family transporter [Bacteroidota bacterium]|nr:DMT family transporter [Bacteroidota bacterium]
MNSRFLALLAAFGATLIYGINHTVAKEVMPDYVGAFGFIFLRLAGAAILFWVIGFFLPREKVAKEDFLRMFFASILGMCINMNAFFKGLELSTPINSGIIITISPILILILSSIFLNEKMNTIKIFGIVLGFGGAILLIAFGAKSMYNAPNITLGNILFLINSTSYAGYIIVVKPITNKYHPITLLKWLFVIGFVLSLPITIKEFNEIIWVSLTPNIIWRILFVILGTTFMTYLLNIYALKRLPAATVGAFIYLQPLIAISFAVLTGNDMLDLIKLSGCLMILSGVYLVSKKPVSMRTNKSES